MRDLVKIPLIHMATYVDFANITGCAVRQFTDDTFGVMRVPVLLLDRELTSDIVFRGNTGTSPGIVNLEFTTIRDKAAGQGSTTANWALTNNQTVNIDGGSTIKREDTQIAFSMPGVPVFRYGFMSQMLYEATAPFSLLKGTNGVYAVGNGTCFGDHPELIYEPCSLGIQGYATFVGELKGGTRGGFGSYKTSQTSLDAVTNWVEEHSEDWEPSEDPYAPGGTNDDDPDKVGGEGDFTDQDEATPLPDLPDLSAIDTGLVTVYNPSNSDLKNLANYLWSDLFSLDTFKKLFADPMDAILGLSIVPVQPPVSGSAEVTVGNIGTGISMPKVSNQYVRVDCGSLNVKEYWGAYLDYSPYTKAEIYLPYIGIRPMNIDDVMKKSIHVYYHVDVLSGGCVCYVYSGEKIAYTYAGSCASAIPISGTDWTNVINGVLSAAGAIGATVATGGMAAPMAVGTIASAAVNGSKPNVEKSGGMSGAAGLLSYQKPFIILTRPRQAMSKEQYKYMGYPSWASRDISALSGYIEVEYVHLDSINATQEELDEIHQLLTTGVIV